MNERRSTLRSIILTVLAFLILLSAINIVRSYFVGRAGESLIASNVGNILIGSIALLLVWIINRLWKQNKYRN